MSGKCAADGSCPAGQHCNEFKFCIDGTPATSVPVQSDRCQTNAECASDYHCNEFHFCIPGAPRVEGDGVHC
jgi:hypothetical protein